MVGEERSPGLGRRCTPLGDQSGDGALGHIDPKLNDFAVDSGGARYRIGGGHLADEGDDLAIGRRAAHQAPPGEFGPVIAKAAPTPTEHGVWGTIMRGCLQPARTLARTSRQRRSVGRSWGRGAVRLYTASCWRRAR